MRYRDVHGPILARPTGVRLTGKLLNWVERSSSDLGILCAPNRDSKAISPSSATPVRESLAKRGFQ
jgi:hypothetical protein